jgi:hypothetical protein
MAQEERVHLYYEALSYQQSQDIRSLDPQLAGDLELLVRSESAVPNGVHLGMHNYPQASSTLPMDRFLTVSAANEQFSWQAKNHMNEVGIPMGDILNVEKRMNFKRAGGERTPYLDESPKRARVAKTTGMRRRDGAAKQRR